MAKIPRDESLDSTLALLSDGYRFISKRCQRYQSDVFQTRIMLQKTICIRGKQAARIFYREDYFQRHAAAPARMQKTLLGEGGVQGMDGEAHRLRKQMFMSFMTPGRIRHLADLTFNQWRCYSGKWEAMQKVVLFDEVREILLRAVCSWSEVPLEEHEVKQRTRDLAAMIEAPGEVGSYHWRGRLARNKSEKWAVDLIEEVRHGKLGSSEESALHVIAWYRHSNGELLDKEVAAVELLNVLRPTMAVGRFVIFAALALYQYPEYRQKLLDSGNSYTDWFVQEVRRFYPFFPFAVARVRKDFEWDGYPFPKGCRVLLDLYGTNHDGRLWDVPEEFLPERFRQWSGDAFSFIPQGGGDPYRGHRCAGEWITIELMKVALKALTELIRYDVPRQDLSISLSQVPAGPKSRFVISNVERIGPSRQ